MTSGACGLCFFTFLLAPFLNFPARCPGVSGSCFVDASSSLVTTSQTGPSATPWLGRGCFQMVHLWFVAIYKREVNTPYRRRVFGAVPPRCCLRCTIGVGCWDRPWSAPLPRDAQGLHSYRFSARWILEQASGPLGNDATGSCSPTGKAISPCLSSVRVLTLLPKPKTPPQQLLQVSAFSRPRRRDDSTQEIPKLVPSCFLPGRVVARRGFAWPISVWGCLCSGKPCVSFAQGC